MKKKRQAMTQTRFIALGFFIMILLGTALLMTPWAARDGKMTDLLSCLFTATSASCVTGLAVVDTYQHWSLFGQIVILILIQIGGLGFVTIGIFFSIFFRRNVGLKARGLMQESVNALQIGGMVKLVKKIIRGTLFLEGTGALLLSIRFIPQMGFWKGLYNGIFHSISAFCNAGFDLMGQYEEYSSLVRYQADFMVNVVIMSLIITGGIGFIVWQDLSQKKLHFHSYELHTKIVLLATLILTISGAVLFYLFERNHILQDASPIGCVLSSLFASVTPRTAGFNTIDIASMQDSSKLLSVVFMFIGGNPGSTAGGIKTTTFVVMLLYVHANLRNEKSCTIFGRRISDDTVKKAGTVFMINLSLAVSAVIAILAIQKLPAIDVLLEVFSAIGTVGMSSGITRELLTAPRIILILLMYAGRIGSMTFALSFTQKKVSAPVQMPVGKITVG